MSSDDVIDCVQKAMWEAVGEDDFLLAVQIVDALIAEGYLPPRQPLSVLPKSWGKPDLRIVQDT
jgi:hypothetical protein